MTKTMLTLLTLWALCAARSVMAAEPQVTEGFINAPAAEVWRLFTTAEGYRQMGVANAEVDLRVGGTIRTHYDAKGALGDAETIVTEILAFHPQHMLATRIRQAPASFPHRAAVSDLWTVIYMTPAGEMTQVRIVGLGYKDDAASEAARAYFEQSNRATLERLAKPYWPQCAVCKQETTE